MVLDEHALPLTLSLGAIAYLEASMGKHQVELRANEGIFAGLAKQNLLFHQCVAELVDNAIAATSPEEKFRIEIVLEKIDDDTVDFFVMDNGRGMSLNTLSQALQLGVSATYENRLNEHGFGMKNALATLSGGNGEWDLWTSSESGPVYHVRGPFGPVMEIRDDELFPNKDFVPAEVATIIKVPVKLSFVQTVQGRGAPAKDLATLREWLIEHLGVLYRGYLEQDPDTAEPDGSIYVSIGRDRLRVPPIPVPLGDMKVERFSLEIGGIVYDFEYRYGTLDEPKRDKLVRGRKAKYYYQGNIPTQGIDIRLGKRVIATRQFETIWKHDDGKRSLARHNNFNDFVGELLIPQMPRGVLTTTNNKTDFNLDDPDWQQIFEKLNDFRPPKKIREKSEERLRNKWVQMIRATNPKDVVSTEKSIWPTGTRIDVYRKTSSGDVILYEIKVGTGQPLHLYQLKMYWDGLVLAEEEPREAVLLVEDFPDTLQEMANWINTKLSSPGKNPYNLKIEKHSDKGL